MGDHDHTKWLDFLRGHGDVIQDALLDALAAHEVEKRGDPSAVFDTLGQGLEALPEEPVPVVPDEEGEEGEPSEKGLQDAQDVYVQVSKMDAEDVLFSVTWGRDSIAVIMEAWFHYIDHECSVGGVILDTFLERLLNQAHDALPREEDHG